MNITIEERMDSIEEQLQEIKKELEQSLERYKESIDEVWLKRESYTWQVKDYVRADT